MHLEQGSAEWRALRKTKVTATDAPVIMGVNKWKKLEQLFDEKMSDEETPINPNMQRGLDLEPIARELFCIKQNVEVNPKVILKDWAMASLDGISECGKHLVEIKCAGKKDHETALKGGVPLHYYPQLQHQMFVADVDRMAYFSFDGFDGVTVFLTRDDEYVKRMVEEELKFLEELEKRRGCMCS